MRFFKLNLFLFLLICIFCISSVLTSAAEFSGRTYNVSEGNLSNTNVTIEVWNDEGTEPSLNISYSCLSNESGHWNLTIPNSTLIPDPNNPGGKSIKFVIRHYNGTAVDYIGGVLPPFPYDDMNPSSPGAMLNISAINFYLKESATLNITALNSSGDGYTNFTYMVKDTKLGFPIDSGWQNQVYQKTVYLPSDRNYSIQIFPQQSMPIYYDLNNLSEYISPKTVNITFNTTTRPIRVTGRVNLSDGTGENFDEFNIINYLLEPGDMVFGGMAMPYNMSSWDCGPPIGCKTDVYNTTSGEYNISLQGTAMTSKVLMFAIAKSGNDYYGGFRNISPTIAGGDTDGFNFTLYNLLGSPANISLQGPMDTTKNILAAETSFAFVNSSGSALTSATAHLEIELDYSNLDPQFPDFTWMLDVGQSNLGAFKLPLLNYSVKKLNMFTQNYAPLKKKYTAAQLSVNRVNITLTVFNPGGFDDSDIMDDLFIGMYKSSSECDVPVPPSSCALTADEGENDFKPLNAVISGGKISFRMRKDSNDITIHYKNVDMLASGPPDAAFDSSANESQTGSALDQAWRFGSQGPEIYDSILIGIPYNDSEVDESAPMNILIDKLYDHDWNVIWNLNAGNSTLDLPSDYADFNKAWFNTTTKGMPCSTSDITANCFVNTTTDLFWLQIPHFSGIAPTVKTTAIGGVNITASESVINCTTECIIYINVTNSNYTLYDNLQNITINTSPVLGYITTFNISRHNGSEFVFNATNSTTHGLYNFTLYNSTPATVHQYRIEINKSNRRNDEFNFTYNVTNMSQTLSVYIALRGDTPSTAPSLWFANDSNKDGNIELNWTDDGNETSENYTIYRYANTTINARINVTNFGNATAIKTGISSGTQFFEDNLTAHGVKYFYALVTVDRYGRSNTSVLSSSLNATANDTINPKSPTGMNITLSTASGTTNNRANIGWKYVTQDVNNNPDSTGVRYLVYWASSINTNKSPINKSDFTLISGDYGNGNVTATNSTTFTCTSCTSATRYHFVVVTADDAGNENLTLDTSNNYLNVTLTYTASTSDGGSSSGGGGGGGGTAVASEGVSASKMWSVLAVGSSTMTVSKSAIAITEIILNMKNQVSNAEVTVTKLDEKPSTLSKPSDEIYQYIRIDKTSIKDADFESVKITFRVTKSWLTSNGVNEGDVALYKYTTKWTKLLTKKIKSESDYVTYEATTSGFSNFAVVGKKSGVKTATLSGDDESTSGLGSEEGADTAESSGAADEEKKTVKGKSWVGWTIVSAVIIIGLAAYFWWGNKRRKNQNPVDNT